MSPPPQCGCGPRAAPVRPWPPLCRPPLPPSPRAHSLLAQPSSPPVQRRTHGMHTHGLGRPCAAAPADEPPASLMTSSGRPRAPVPRTCGGRPGLARPHGRPPGRGRRRGRGGAGTGACGWRLAGWLAGRLVRPWPPLRRPVRPWGGPSARTPPRPAPWPATWMWGTPARRPLPPPPLRPAPSRTCQGKV